MTMHDDSNLKLLERGLTALAARRAGDEGLRLALRDELAASMRAPASRRWSIRVRLGAAAIAVAAAAVAVVTLVGAGGSDGPTAASAAIVRHALDAVTPPANSILHTEVVGVQNGTRVLAESWQETSRPYASRGLKGPLGHQGEFSDNGTTTFEYNPVTNTISEQPESSRPTFTDPVSQVRRELAGGSAVETGTVTIGGTLLYKIDLPDGLVGYFDMRDYRPRYLDDPQSDDMRDYRPRYLDDPQSDGSVIRLRVAAYQYLPMTPANRAELNVTEQHPSARIVTRAERATAGK